ncbi:hypothetical protein [Chryseobacterium indologenes]|uniref:hypothetical protein n=1 Tax=Chryseobacterium indologenes TaxID=253 RepID=UPI001BCC07B5|nr:hypothetical protein [Chryseobacterium indologenes]
MKLLKFYKIRKEAEKEAGNYCQVIISIFLSSDLLFLLTYGDLFQTARTSITQPI